MAHEPYSNRLEELIYNCGGPVVVARELGLRPASIWEWIQKGHLPFTDLTGRTKYSKRLAKLQVPYKLTPRDIRRIGLLV